MRRVHRIYGAGLVPYDEVTPYDGPPMLVKPIAAAWQFHLFVVWKLLMDRDNGIEGAIDAEYRAINSRIRR